MELILLLLILLIIYIGQEKFTSPSITLLVRSYNRPEYLSQLLISLKNADLSLCKDKLIYDDYSTNRETLKLLNEFEKIGFRVIRSSKNEGVTISMVNALNQISSGKFICCLDNDTIVKSNFLKVLVDTFNKIKRDFRGDILLSGFNCTNCKIHKIIKNNDNYIEKNTIGGVSLFFDYNLLPFVKKGWNQNKDWGVLSEVKKKGGKICVTYPGVVQHIGKQGLSIDFHYDKDETW